RDKLNVNGDIPDVLDKFCPMGFSKMNPESQKTGIPTKYPIKEVLNAGIFLPNAFQISWARTNAAWLFSKSTPSTQPSIIINPIWPIKPPKPLVNSSNDCRKSSPAAIPTHTDAIVRHTNGWILEREVPMIIHRMAQIIWLISGVKFIAF